ncbi:MAG TPA: class I SAM-dependent methyltransferase [Candidatus Saccharimonas sp.]|nr:class I SAM-dependent methyltransferase [Candidatus Saccharimonas sp.]
MAKTAELFKYEGYEIPMDLVDLTGGGADTWDVISKGHMNQYEQYTPLKPDHFFLEVGCGVGRDAMQLAKVLDNGKYVGFDIIKPSIDWCTANITPKYPHFTFHYYDVYSQIHNGGGKLRVSQVKLPASNGEVDRIALHSVFTHMFRDDIQHYLHEFRRVLKPGGLVLASFFVLDPESREMAKTSPHPLKFEHPYGDGCWINDKDYPEGAIGYTPEVINGMLSRAGLRLVDGIHRGFWSGREGVTDGQDILILEPDPEWQPASRWARLFGTN